MSDYDSASENTWVFVWKLTPQKVGHTALQIGGRNPKLDNAGGGEYISIHPAGIPAIGPTTVLPLPAVLAKSLTEDMKAEAEAQRKDPWSVDIDGTTDDVARSRSLDQPVSIQPDFVYCISGLNSSAIREKMREIESGVGDNKVSYQLLPRINALGFFKELPYFIAQDPVDTHILFNKVRANRSPLERKEVYNCSTLVSKLLFVGGLPPIKSTIFPWDPTPNSITQHLDDRGFKPIRGGIA